MRIAMFSDYFHPELGGIQDSLAAIAPALARSGHRVDLHVPRYGARDYRRIGLVPHELDLGPAVTIHRHQALHAPSTTQQSRVAWPSLLPALWRTARTRPDIIHLHSFLSLGLEAVAIGGLLRIPVIGTNHTAIAAFAPYLPVKPGWATAYVAWFHNRCDVVTAPSRSVLDDIDAELGPAWLKRPRHVISNPIDTKLFRPATTEDRHHARTRLGFTGPTICYAGRLGPEKNLDVLVQALAHTETPTILAIAGHGSDQARLETLAETHGVAHRVRMLGTLPQHELAALMQASDVFAMPSTSETQSMTTLQAMACGLPVVAANARALPEFVTPANGILVDPCRVEAWAAALCALLGDPTRRSRLGSAGMESVQRYGLPGVTADWERLYRDVTNKGLAA